MRDGWRQRERLSRSVQDLADAVAVRAIHRVYDAIYDVQAAINGCLRHVIQALGDRDQAFDAFCHGDRQRDGVGRDDGESERRDMGKHRRRPDSRAIARIEKIRRKLDREGGEQEADQATLRMRPIACHMPSKNFLRRSPKVGILISPASSTSYWGDVQREISYYSVYAGWRS